MTLRTALRKDKVESFRKLLTARRASLSEDIRKATQERLENDHSFSDTLDQASAEVDRSLTLQMRNRDRDVIFQIDAALKRIDEGTFGGCEKCDEPISEARIKAFPFTTLCIDCKAELESEGLRFTAQV